VLGFKEDLGNGRKNEEKESECGFVVRTRIVLCKLCHSPAGDCECGTGRLLIGCDDAILFAHGGAG